MYKERSVETVTGAERAGRNTVYSKPCIGFVEEKSPTLTRPDVADRDLHRHERPPYPGARIPHGPEPQQPPSGDGPAAQSRLPDDGRLLRAASSGQKRPQGRGRRRRDRGRGHGDNHRLLVLFPEAYMALLHFGAEVSDRGAFSANGGGGLLRPGFPVAELVAEAGDVRFGGEELSGEVSGARGQAVVVRADLDEGGGFGGEGGADGGEVGVRGGEFRLCFGEAGVGFFQFRSGFGELFGGIFDVGGARLQFFFGVAFFGDERFDGVL
mmetsp:Transcript_32201/g.74140  ORF Transcript_32201/g.74140 Transcript_32201/m.74140 type:complete len:268 (+) Transcript_32201:212-1015(+)